jgi:hypothetical protein
MIKSYKGNSLVVTVVISLVLAIVCSSVILLAYYNRHQQLRVDAEHRLQINLESATNLVLADSSISFHLTVDTLDLFKEKKDSVEIKKELWGLFQVAGIKSFYRNFSKERRFFYGPSLPAYMNACLYLADHKRSIALVGNTNLTGDGFLPEAGIKASLIDQKKFTNTKLIDGSIKKSKDSLPPLNKRILNNLSDLIQYKLQKDSQDIPDSLQQSFADAPVYFYKKTKISLVNCSLSGHIFIKSDDAIEIDSTARLNNIILVAPSIHFKEGVKTTVQAFATDSLIVDKNCSFEYPSVLLMLKMKNATIQNKMVIGENCKLDGIILSVCRSDDFYKTLVEVGENFKMKGVIYTMGHLNLKGKVEGVVLTDFFVYKSPTTTYENYLVDVSINRKRLPEYFLASSVFSISASNGIIQWIK